MTSGLAEEEEVEQGPGQTVSSGADIQDKGKKRRSTSRRGICQHQDCTKQAVQGGVCILHGAQIKRCRVPGCSKHSQRGGVCMTHGAKVKRCLSKSCRKYAVYNGYCSLHKDEEPPSKTAEPSPSEDGRKPANKSHAKEIRYAICQLEGCSRPMVQRTGGGVCREHSSVVRRRRCGIRDCPRYAKAKGFCLLHQHDTESPQTD